MSRRMCMGYKTKVVYMDNGIRNVCEAWVRRLNGIHYAEINGRLVRAYLNRSPLDNSVYFTTFVKGEN